MEKSGSPLRGVYGLLIRFVSGSFVILLLLSVYCLNISHRWKEGVGALPVEHIGWLPASAFQPGSIETLGTAVALLAACGLAMSFRRRQVEMLMSGLVAAAALTSLAVIGQRLSPRPFPVFDLTGFFPYENHFAAFANLVLPVALCAGVRHRIRAFEAGKISSPAGLFFCAAGLMMAAVSLCGSRAGLLIAGLICGGWLLLLARLYRRYPQIGFSYSRRVLRWAVAAAVFILGLALIWFASQLRRVGGDLVFRGQVLADTVAMWLDNPFWGSGPGSFSAIFPYYQSLPAERYSFLHAHCEPLQFLAEYGVLGCLILAGGTGWILFPRRGKKAGQRAGPSFRELEGAGIGLALAGVALHSLIDFPFRHLLIALLTAVWIGTIFSYSCRGGAGMKNRS